MEDKKMNIFDDDVINKINQEAERKKQEEQKKQEARQAARRKEEDLLTYIMECLREFPAAAKKVGLEADTLYVNIPNSFGYGCECIKAWKVASQDFGRSRGIDCYITADGDCIIHDTTSHDTSDDYENRYWAGIGVDNSSVSRQRPILPAATSLRSMAEQLYSLSYYRSKEAIKRDLINALSGRPKKVLL